MTIRPGIMLDLETLGTRPGSAILSIGAVRFDESGVFSEFYERIDLQSCVDLGLVIDPATVLWWMERDDAARHELLKPGTPVVEVLQAFAGWVGDGEVEMWGNGPSFDNTILAAAYHAAGRAVPWKYKHERCYRTMAAMWPEIPLVRDGTHHHALDDARTQALHLLQILRSSPVNKS